MDVGEQMRARAPLNPVAPALRSTPLRGRVLAAAATACLRAVAGLAAFSLLAAPARPEALAQGAAPHRLLASPLDLYGPLFTEVELLGLFGDSKTFADAIALSPADEILDGWRASGSLNAAGLRRFVLQHFRLPGEIDVRDEASGLRKPLHQHIADLWPLLTRPALAPELGSSAIALPHPYVVPGGRFRELYYWDSYFTMLGLQADGRDDLVEAMIDDFGSLIARFGHIPNGARTYYLSRSQPPLFYAMVALSRSRDPAIQSRRLAWMRTEHAFWMEGETGLGAGEARAHVVALPDGAVLNRYFDPRDTPRDESYREDVQTARTAAGRPASEVYQALRAGAESGWDYSSRWLGDGRTLSTIHTLDIVPVDLNSLLYGLETAIAAGCREAGDRVCAKAYEARSRARAAAVQRYLWDEEEGLYRDYDWRAGARTALVSAATLYPLFSGLAPPAAGVRIAVQTRRRLLAEGGLRTTSVRSGQQWDAPNGWAPLQWIAVAGLRRYGQKALADDVACRWTATVQSTYARDGALVEKYDVESANGSGGGGEYRLQVGFGWTNGVSEALLGTRCPRGAGP